MSRTRKLDPIEIRVLGALLEKEQTTPEQYPLTINAVIAACNQKTNRDPVMKLTETEVVEALDRMREDVLVWNTHGARAERWQQSIDRRWGLDRKSKPIMTLLLLRGPQTTGELRTRSERMFSFESVAEVEETLAQLAEGFDALVCELPRRPGQREARWMHLESTEGDPRERLEDFAATPPPVSPVTPAAIPAAMMSSPASPAPGASAADERLSELGSKVEELESTVAALRSGMEGLGATVSTLQEQMRALREDLGCD